MVDPLVHEALNRREISDEPPVLIDIGASGALHPEWKAIARHSVAVAFDPDDREMGYTVKETSAYKTLYVFNCVVTDRPPQTDTVEFYLTRSPFCSSLLKPRNDKLDRWAFGDLFVVERQAPIHARTLSSVLTELGLARVDWFKTDSQGIDLRLFESMGEGIVAKALAAEFEPGILDAYQGEDKLWSLMKFMDAHPFWMSDMTVKGTHRIRPSVIAGRFGAIHRKYFPQLLRTTPGWAEVMYLNTFENEADFRVREYLLGWIFAVVKKQHGFAIDLALEGQRRFGDPIFARMAEHSTNLVKRELYRKVPAIVASSILRRIRKLAS